MGKIRSQSMVNESFIYLSLLNHLRMSQDLYCPFTLFKANKFLLLVTKTFLSNHQPCGKKRDSNLRTCQELKNWILKNKKSKIELVFIYMNVCAQQNWTTGTDEQATSTHRHCLITEGDPCCLLIWRCWVSVRGSMWVRYSTTQGKAYLKANQEHLCQ